MNITTIIIEFVGSPTHIHDQCQVSGYDVKIDHEKKEMFIGEHSAITIKDFTRKDKVNYCRLEIPEGVYCNYFRKIQVKPLLYEGKWFMVKNGEMIILKDDIEGLSRFDLQKFFFKEYVGKYKVVYGKSLPYQHTPEPIRIK